jgi:Copper transport outer membrane protein, MctB
MLDYRYHALSLAAVLLALAVGVVIGVAIGDSSLVSSAKSGIVHQLRSEVDAAKRENRALHAQLDGEEAFVDNLYPIAVRGLLAGRSVGLVFLGGSSDRVDGLVREAVTRAGGTLLTVVGVRTPLDLAGIAREAPGTSFATLGSGQGAEAEALAQRFGVIVGRQLVSGGQLVERELISRVRARLLSAFDGRLGRLDGLVVMRSQVRGAPPAQQRATEAFQVGLVEGSTEVGIPTVGVELTSTTPSEVPWYEREDMSSVDDLQATAGQAALAYALAGSRGAYGTKPTADSLLPNVGATSAKASAAGGAR